MNHSSASSFRRLRDLAALALFLAVLSAMSWRLYEHRPLPGSATRDRFALADFRHAIYYPLLAVRDGVNPYDTVCDGDPHRYMQRYPVFDTFPLYSPTILLFFAPLGLFPVGASLVVFAVLNALLFVLLAWLTLRAIGRIPQIGGVFGVAALLLASQPGRAAFYAGQVALPLALATIGALQWGDRRSWRSGAFVAFSTLKPTFGGPLGLLLLARRDWRSSLGGLALGGILGGIGLITIFARSGDLSLQRVTQVLARNQSDFYQDPTVTPQTNKARVDLGAAVEYLTNRPLPGWVGPVVAAMVLGLTGWCLWRDHRSSDVASAVSLTSAVVMLAMYICIYHNVYDLLLLVVPIAACATAAHASWKKITPAWRRVVLALLLLPFVNVIWTNGFGMALARAGISWGESGGVMIGWAYRVSCAANGLALTGAWGILLVCVARAHNDERPRPGRRKRFRAASFVPSQTA